jgi:hypothetical protein
VVKKRGGLRFTLRDKKRQRESENLWAKSSDFRIPNGFFAAMAREDHRRKRELKGGGRIPVLETVTRRCQRPHGTAPGQPLCIQRRLTGSIFTNLETAS